MFSRTVSDENASDFWFTEETHIDDKALQMIKAEEHLKHQKGIEHVITNMLGVGFAKVLILIAVNVQHAIFSRASYEKIAGEFTNKTKLTEKAQRYLIEALRFQLRQ